MNYRKLASELLQKRYKMRQARPQKQIDDSRQGEQCVSHFIASHTDSVQPAEISNTMGISSPRIAVALHSLKRKELVTRQLDKSDRRQIFVERTPEEKTVANKPHQQVMEALTHTRRLSGKHDAREYVRIIGKRAEKDPLQNTTQEGRSRFCVRLSVLSHASHSQHIPLHKYRS